MRRLSSMGVDRLPSGVAAGGHPDVAPPP